MDTLASYKKNSFSFSKKELQILKEMLNYFKYEIPNGEGSYLTMIDLDSIDFRWSPKMTLTDCGVFGTWSWTSKDKVYVKPSSINKQLVENIENGEFHSSSKEELVNSSALPEMRSRYLQFNNYSEFGLDNEIVDFIFHLTDNDGVILSTIFHELYHKFQYSSAPILYIFNLAVSKVMGYENSTKCSLSIEGDVRKYVDNEHLWNSIKKFNSIFLEWISAFKTKQKLQEDYDMIKNSGATGESVDYIIEKYESAVATLKNIEENPENKAHARFLNKMLSYCHLSR